MPISASYDGSGKDNDHPVITVASYYADDSLCEAIKSDWTRATGGKPFHLADFGTGRCKIGSREWTITERSCFLKRLGSIVNREGVQIISHSVEVDQYRTFLARTEFADIYGPAYSALAIWCVYATETQLKNGGLHLEKVAHMFEKGERVHELLQTLEDFQTKGGMIAPDTRSHHFMPKDTTLLQPSDLIAGVIQRLLLRSVKGVRCLDNGGPFTPISNFEHFYSEDGVTSAVIPGNATVFRTVVNRQAFSRFDEITKGALAQFPHILKSRRKAKINQGNRERTKYDQGTLG